MRHTHLVSTFILALLLSSCGGGEGEARTAGVDNTSAVVTVSAEAAGANCVNAGSKIEAGLDTDRNGTLAASEVSGTQYLCNGASGATGAAGSAGAVGASGAAGSADLNALVQMLDEPSGANCAAGGKAINVGVVVNANGVLDASEVSSTGYVCGGANGTAGANGASGTNGTKGTNGLNTLVSIANEPAGANCVYGGSKVSAGLDSNGNSVLDVGEVSATSYPCNGAPDAGLNWINVTGTTQQAEANTGYIANNDTAQVVVTLPLNPTAGDIVRISGAGLGGWKVAQNAEQAVNTKSLGGMAGANWTAQGFGQIWVALSSSADGSKLVAATQNGLLYTSVDSGVSWVSRESKRDWTDVASSSDGMKLAAVDFGGVGGSGGYVYTSADGGKAWTARGLQQYWVSVALSGDGERLVAVAQRGQIHTSTDGGATWTAHEANRGWASVASSSDGSKLVAAAFAGKIYTSNDGGMTWTDHESSRWWNMVASSADGSRLVAVEYGGQIYTSSDGGVVWLRRATDSNRNWIAVDSSADGSKLVAVAQGGQIYTSIDAGASWTARDFNRNWTSVALSADGSKLVAGMFNGPMFTSTPETTLGTGGSISGSQFDAITLQYVGGGMFNVLSHEGQLTAQ